MRRAGERGWGRRAVLPSALALLAATFLLVALPEPATAHTGDYILSVPAADPVSVDGNVTAAEWAEAVSINLAGIPGNRLEAFLLVKHNDSFLFVAYDVVGDTSEGPGDFSLVAFDTGHDGLTTVGREDIFYHAGFFAEEQAHYVSDGMVWSVHDSPYDESLPNHAGLASAWGVGPSALSSESHRQFEFRIPLPLLGATLGDTLGILAAVGDLDTGKLSFWPETLVSLQLDSYGDLVLVTPATANDLLLLPPSRVKNALAGDLVSYQLNVTNRGTSGVDTFDFTANSSWAVTFWDSAGTMPLADTNGDGDPDTGALYTGESALVIAKVEVPTDVAGRNEATVTATSFADANVSRGALLITNLPPALFRPPHSDYGNDTDVPPDGLFNYLVVEANLTVAVSGSYIVQGTLYDQNFTSPISYASRSGVVPVGNQTAALLFPGEDVFRSGTNGPYAVDLRIFDDSFPPKELDRSNHTTQPYAYTHFQKPAAVFAPPHSDFGLDTEGDDLFNYLVVNASIDVTDGGMFLVDAVLRDPTYSLFIYTSNVTTLDAGLQTVPLWFDGIRVNSSDIDGPYTVELTMYDYATFELLDRGAHTTANYSHLEFQSPPAAFAAPHSDFGLDTDGDGAFNSLVVDVSLEVDVAGMYLVDGLLHDENFTFQIFSYNTTHLDVGSQSVQLFFLGTRINASEVDGPYTVDLNLYDYVTFTFLDDDVHTTTAYASEQFEGPEPLVASEALVTPTIDGAFSPGEWSDAYAVNLAAIPGNEVPGFLLVKNDDDFLYVAYDATGDTTEDLSDVASIAFDTDHDGVATDGREDQFVQGGWVSNDQAHFVYDASVGFWIEEDSPYDTSLPNHMGLASAWGFGPSENDGTPHRIYEFSIPLALLGVAPGGTLGFFGGSEPAPGLFDASVGGWSLWPVWNPGPLSLSEYGDLVLSMPTDLIPPTLVINAPSSGSVEAGSGVLIAWSASDDQSGLDYLEVSLDDGAPIVLEATATGYTFLGLEDGSHTVEVRAVDVAGNAQTASVDFTVDTVPPTLSILSPGSEAILDMSRVEVAWVAEDITSGVDRFEVVLDGGAPTVLLGASTVLVFSEMSDGPHTVEVRAIDGAGHGALASVDFVVDTAPPVLSVSLPVEASVVTTSSVEVVWLGTDQTSGIDRFEVSLDGGTPVVLPATTVSHAFAGVGDGPHTVTVVAFDRAGNAVALTVDLRVDTSVFSPTGPYGSGPLIGTVVGIAVAAALALVLLLRRGWLSGGGGATRSPGTGLRQILSAPFRRLRTGNEGETGPEEKSARGDERKSP